MLRYEILPVTAFVQNSSILWCDQTMEAAVIDPGGEEDRIMQAVMRLGVQVKQILLTHGHVDHCAGAASLAQTSRNRRASISRMRSSAFSTSASYSFISGVM